MRSTIAFSLGMLASAGLFFAVAAAPAALGGGDCAPGAPAGAGAAGPAGSKAEAPAPKREPAISNAFLTGMVGDWSCDCAYPTGGHAAGGATASLVLDGTAMMTTSTLDWTVAEGKEPEKIHSLAIWKVGADGKTLSYWGFSSHDTTVDVLTGTVSDTSATVAGETRWGPMRVNLSMKDGALQSQLWIDKRDMGVISYKKK